MSWHRNLFESPRAQKTAFCLVGLVTLVFMFQMYHKAYRPQGYDFTGYLQAADALWNGQSPYTVSSPSYFYAYPMFFAMIMVPFTLLPYSVANLLWFCINVASLGYSVYLALTLMSARLGTTLGRHLYVPLTCVAFLLIELIQHNLLNGQVNFLVLLCCLLFLKASQDKKEVRAAFFLSVAISVKLVPLIFLMFLLFRRKYTILACTVLFSLIFCFSPCLLLGNDGLPAYNEYLHTFLFKKLADPSGDLSHLVEAPEDGDRPDIFFTVYGLTHYFWPETAGALWRKPMGLLVVLIPVMVLEWTQRKTGNGKNTSWVFNIYLVAILLLSPWSETHHMAFLVPGVCLVFIKVLFDRRWARPLNQCEVVLFFLLYTIGTFHKLSPAYFFAVLTLFVLLFQAVISNSAGATATQDHPVESQG